MTPRPPQARLTDPPTSHSAAESAAARQTQHQADVLVVLSHWPGLTDEEIARFHREAFPDRPQSPSGLRTRRSELVTQRKVRDSGKRRMTASGRKTIVWEVVR